jgi:hypothetical protein
MEFLEELEKTMALLAFEDSTKSPVGYLLDHSQRQKTASELNAVILTAQCQEKGMFKLYLLVVYPPVKSLYYLYIYIYIIIAAFRGS